MEDKTPTLSKRGRELTSDRLGPNAREATEKIGFYDAPWNAVTNPNGLINLGTAENVRSRLPTLDHGLSIDG